MFRAHGRIAVRSKGEGTLTLTQRIRLSRRHGSLSQAALADLVGVHRSAVSHWESTKPKKPNIGHLLAIAVACGVQFEWLATGRGTMLLSEQMQQDMTPAAHALMVEDAPTAKPRRSRAWCSWNWRSSWRDSGWGAGWRDRRR